MSREYLYTTEDKADDIQRAVRVLEWDISNIKKEDVLSIKMQQLKAYKAALEGLKRAE